MSTYKHLSKAGSRFLEQVQAKNSSIAKQFAKYEGITMPEFLKPSLERVDKEKQFKSEVEWKFLPGDRIVIVKGELKGNICSITQHDTHTNGYILDENGPTKTVPVPKQFWQAGQNSHMVSFPVPVSQDDIKLACGGHRRSQETREREDCCGERHHLPRVVLRRGLQEADAVQMCDRGGGAGDPMAQARVQA